MQHLTAARCLPHDNKQPPHAHARSAKPVLKSHARRLAECAIVVLACLQDEEEEEAEPAKPVKAERPRSRDYANAQKKTNLRSEDQTFKVQEEQRYVGFADPVMHKTAVLVPLMASSNSVSA